MVLLTKISKMLIFSIDPGLVNLGVCFFNTDDNMVVWADKVQLVPRLKDLKSEAEIIPRVYKLFFTGKIWKMIENSDIVLIEQQMKRKYLNIQFVLGAILFEKKIEYTMVSPRVVKSHFQSGKLARKTEGKSVRGKKNNYLANKKHAIQLATSLFPAFMSKISLKKRDDVADALLQAKYWAMKNI